MDWKLAVFLVIFFCHHKGESFLVSDLWWLEAIKVTSSWESGILGQGVRVLVLDSGIDKDHPSLKYAFEKGRSFIDSENRESFPYRKQIPYEYFDSDGHGTSVASLIAGGSGLGVAPLTKILSGKVFQNNTSTYHQIVEGIEWGIAEKVDIINLSISGKTLNPELQEAIQKAENEGISVVVPAGNRPKRAFKTHVLAPSLTQEILNFPLSWIAIEKNVVSVGSVGDSFLESYFSIWGPELLVAAPGEDIISAIPQKMFVNSQLEIDQNNNQIRFISHILAEESSYQEGTLTKELSFLGYGSDIDFIGRKIQNHFVLMRGGGGIPLSQKVASALAGKASGVIIYHNSPGLFSVPIFENNYTFPLPIIFVTQEEGEWLIKQITDLERTSQKLRVTFRRSPKLFQIKEGTSLSTAIVSGVVALLKSYCPQLSPQQIRDLIKESATTLAEFQGTGYGLVNATAAIRMASRRNNLCSKLQQKKLTL